MGNELLHDLLPSLVSCIVAILKRIDEHDLVQRHIGVIHCCSRGYPSNELKMSLSEQSCDYLCHAQCPCQHSSCD